MKKKTRSRPVSEVLITLAFLFSLESTSQATTWWTKNNVVEKSGGPELNAAHAAFLAKDYDRMALLLRDSLLKSKNAPAFVENAAALMHRAYIESVSHRINPEWHVCDGIEYLRISQIRRDSPDSRTRYILRISGDQAAIGSVDQVSVSYAGGETLLDKIGGLGLWDESSYKGEPWFNISGRRFEPYPLGLYLFSIRMKSGSGFSGWFILHDSDVQRTPNILEPSPGSVLSTNQPLVRWEPFKSAEWQPFEKRNATVAMRFDGEDDTLEWEYDAPEPNIDRVTIGQEPVNGRGNTHLPNGPYYLTVSYREARRFGDVLLRREAQRRIPLTVAKE